MIGKWQLGSDPTGFDFWQILPGQGVYYNPPMIRQGEPIKAQGYVTDVITEVTLSRMASCEIGGLLVYLRAGISRLASRSVPGSAQDLVSLPACSTIRVASRR